MRYDGNVVIMGDVNPGGQVTATGHVIVLGSLKGTVHAGANGDESAYVLALRLRPIQIRIGRQIAVSPSAQHSATGPQVATVRAGQIIFEPYERFLNR
jgi:septum site-determining protein MinC